MNHREVLKQLRIEQYAKYGNNTNKYSQALQYALNLIEDYERVKIVPGEKDIFSIMAFSKIPQDEFGRNKWYVEETYKMFAQKISHQFTLALMKWSRGLPLLPAFARVLVELEKNYSRKDAREMFDNIANSITNSLGRYEGVTKKGVSE